MDEYNYISEQVRYVVRQIGKGMREADADLAKNGGGIEDVPCTVCFRMRQRNDSIEFSVTFRPGQMKEAEG